MSEFDGLSAVVTGGGLGIGLATARLLAERGARVAVLDREIGAVEPPIAGIAVDVTDKAGVHAGVEEAVTLLGDRRACQQRGYRRAGVRGCDRLPGQPVVGGDDRDISRGGRRHAGATSPGWG